MAYLRPRFMARELRIQYPGAIYHVMNRGDHQERIFCDDEDRKMFLATLAQVGDKTRWQIHSYSWPTPRRGWRGCEWTAYWGSGVFAGTNRVLAPNSRP